MLERQDPSLLCVQYLFFGVFMTVISEVVHPRSLGFPAQKQVYVLRKLHASDPLRVMAFP